MKKENISKYTCVLKMGLKYIKSIVISFIVFSLIFTISYSLFADRLTDSEYVAVNDLYTDIRRVDSDIKNDFYTEILIKYLDKEFIVNEMRKDTLTYCIDINKNIITMLEEGRTKRDINNYIMNKDRSFYKFKDLNVPIKLFEIYRSFANYYIADEEFLDSFGVSVYNVIVDEQNELGDIASENNLKLFFIVFAYLILLLITHLFLVGYVTKGKIICIFSSIIEAVKKIKIKGMKK